MKLNVRLDVREALLHLAACVPEDLQGRFGHLLVVHFQAAEQRLKRLGRVEGHGVGEGEHLHGRREKQRMMSPMILQTVPIEEQLWVWFHLEQLQSRPDGLLGRDAFLFIVRRSIYRFVHLFYQSTVG